MNEDLKLIKKKYGEKMMHLCRELFPTLLEHEGLLSDLILRRFDVSRFLYEDIVNNNLENEFKNYIYSLIDVEKLNNMKVVLKRPKELLEEAGYDLYECKSELDIQRFKTYYAPREELCTFSDHRLKKCYVFFAVKKNVNEIRRENFLEPKRQDEYGTSVISIQFSKGLVNTLSIKNRYNHSVNNPDSTFSNNLDNIIPGLTSSFEREYGFNFKNFGNSFEIPGYVLASDGKFYKYNYEIDNIYYCTNNIIIDNFNVIDIYNKEPERYIVFDYFILDLVEKKLFLYSKTLNDSFIDYFQNIIKINVIKSGENGNKIIEVISSDNNLVKIELDKTNKILSYSNNVLESVGESFLSYNNSLTKLELVKLKSVKGSFLYDNKTLTNLYLPSLEEAGIYFMFRNNSLINLNLPNLKKVNGSFLYENDSLVDLSLPNLVIVGDHFLNSNNKLNYLNLPKVEEVSNDFLYENNSLLNLSLPELVKVSDRFLFSNKVLMSLSVPKLKYAEIGFLYENLNLIKLEAPSLMIVDNSFLHNNLALISLVLPSLVKVANSFLYSNKKLSNFEASKLVAIDDYFMFHNEELKHLDLSNVLKVGTGFLYKNNRLINLKMSNLREIESSFLKNNNSLFNLQLLNLETVEDDFMLNNTSLMNLEAPKLRRVGDNFLIINSNINKSGLFSLKNEENDTSIKTISSANEVLVRKIIEKFKQHVINDYFEKENKYRR